MRENAAGVAQFSRMLPLDRGGDMRFPAHPLRAHEVVQLIETARSSRQGVRNAALVALLWRTGLRSAELCSVQVGDVYWSEVEGMRCGWLRVERPKGIGRYASPREVGFDPQTGKLLAEWLEVRGRAPGPLFCTGAGEAVQPSYLRQLLPRLAGRCGLDRRVHPHALRHTFARELWDEQKDLVVVMLALGHSDPRTTMKYLRSIGATEVLNATTRREW